jgi:hypothetical protein
LISSAARAPDVIPARSTVSRIPCGICFIADS